MIILGHGIFSGINQIKELKKKEKKSNVNTVVESIFLLKLVYSRIYSHFLVKFEIALNPWIIDFSARTCVFSLFGKILNRPKPLDQSSKSWKDCSKPEAQLHASLSHPPLPPR